MASALKNLSTYDESNIPSAEDMSFGIVVADWNKEITHALYEGCYETLIKHGAKEKNIKQYKSQELLNCQVAQECCLKTKRLMESFD